MKLLHGHRRGPAAPTLLARAVAPALASLVLVAAGCGSTKAAPGNSGTNGTTAAVSGATTSAAASITITTKVVPEWETVSNCPIGPPTAGPAGTPATEGVAGVVDYGKQDQTHVDGCVNYVHRPAVGGAHHPVWANCGFYTSPVPEEVAVHVLEHGGVWIAFDPSLDQASLQKIRNAANATTHILANPYPGATSKVVMTAWSRQLDLDSVNDPRFQQFIDTYLQGPQTPELGAACSGGLGTPG